MAPITAVKILQAWNQQEARSRPLKVLADDKKQYVVKGLWRDGDANQAPRLVLEQITGHLGSALGAPVAKVAIVHLTEDLIVERADTRLMVPGPCHASEYLSGCDTYPKGHVPPAGEDIRWRRSLGLLAVLLGWISLDATVSEPQFLVCKVPRRRIYSIDHGLLSGKVPVWQNDREIDFEQYWSNLS